MKLKTMKEKMLFIDGFSEEDNQSIKKKLSIIRKLSLDKNPEIRMELAKQLVLFDIDEIEEILYQMLFDKNRGVRLEAIDSLVIGRQEKTIEKVKNMMEGEGYLIRAYAVSTIFELITNHYGINSYAFEKYEEIASRSYLNEKNPRVLIIYYQNYVFLDNENGLHLLENVYTEAVEQKNYELIWLLLHVFKEIQNCRNKEHVNKILNYKIEKLLSAQKELVIKMRTNAIPQKILIVDKNNTYLSHVVSCVLHAMNISNVEISTAGLEVGLVQKKEISEFCESYGIKAEENYYSKKIMSAHLYDYVIFLNTEISKEKYSLCKGFYYEGINEDSDQEIIEICNNIKQLLK